MKGGDETDLLQCLAEFFGKVGHLIKGVDASLVEPPQDLDAPVSLFSERSDKILQLGRAEIFKVGLFCSQDEKISRALKKYPISKAAVSGASDP